MINIYLFMELNNILNMHLTLNYEKHMPRV